MRREKTRGPNGQSLKSTKISKTKLGSGWGHDLALYLVLCGWQCVLIEIAIFEAEATFEVDASAIKIKSGTCMTKRKASWRAYTTVNKGEKREAT